MSSSSSPEIRLRNAFTKYFLQSLSLLYLTDLRSLQCSYVKDRNKQGCFDGDERILLTNAFSLDIFCRDSAEDQD